MIHSKLTRRFIVRHGFSQEDEWRDTFGYAVPLACFAYSEGHLDAPLYVPSGGTDYRGSACSVALRSQGVYE